MARRSLYVTILIAILLLVQVPGVSSDWKPLKVSPSSILIFPTGGGTCSTSILLPTNILVNNATFNLTGLPAYKNYTYSADASEMWNVSTERNNLSLGQDGIGLGGYGSWWEQETTDIAFGQEGNISGTKSPILNVSEYSRVIVQGDFPNGTEYCVSVLDPNAGNVTLQSGLHNGDQLDLSFWAGQGSAYRDLVLKLTMRTTNPNATPVLRKWGVGTEWRAIEPMTLPSSLKNLAKYSYNPVLLPGNPGDWDSSYIGSPTVVKVGSKYYMWYAAVGNGPSSIGLATSEDGLSWRKSPLNPVIRPGAGSWESSQVYEPSVLFDGNIFHMWYSSSNSVNAWICYANSTDGSTWTKYGGNPVLSPVPGGWESLHVYDPCILKFNKTFFMWYSAHGSDPAYRVGLATSSDGINWTRNPNNPLLDIGTPGSWDSFYAHGPAIILENGTYHMWYHGSDRNTVSIGYASSMDGINWVKSPSNPVLKPGPAGYDSNYLYGPAAIRDGNKYRLWYGGNSLSQSSICLATSRFNPSYSAVSDTLSPFSNGICLAI